VGSKGSASSRPGVVRMGGAIRPLWDSVGQIRHVQTLEATSVPVDCWA
jgi:hypothetical protein